MCWRFCSSSYRGVEVIAELGRPTEHRPPETHPCPERPLAPARQLHLKHPGTLQDAEQRGSGGHRNPKPSLSGLDAAMARFLKASPLRGSWLHTATYVQLLISTHLTQVLHRLLPSTAKPSTVLHVPSWTWRGKASKGSCSGFLRAAAGPDGTT